MEMVYNVIQQGKLNVDEWKILKYVSKVPITNPFIIFKIIVYCG